MYATNHLDATDNTPVSHAIHRIMEHLQEEVHNCVHYLDGQEISRLGTDNECSRVESDVGSRTEGRNKSIGTAIVSNVKNASLA